MVVEVGEREVANNLQTGGGHTKTEPHPRAESVPDGLISFLSLHRQTQLLRLLRPLELWLGAVPMLVVVVCSSPGWLPFLGRNLLLGGPLLRSRGKGLRPCGAAFLRP